MSGSVAPLESLFDQAQGQALPLPEELLTLEEQLPQAREQIAALASVEIDYDQVTQQLQEEGVHKFLDAFRTLFACIETKREKLQA